jgi:hypothetical protein
MRYYNSSVQTEDRLHNPMLRSKVNTCLPENKQHPPFRSMRGQGKSFFYLFFLALFIIDITEHFIYPHKKW